MAQNYTIHTFDPGKEPFIDRNGNQWINVLFEGELSNPTKWVMRPDSVAKYKVGDTVFGRIDQVDGKNYQRFYKEQKPDGGYGSAPTQAGQVAQAKYAPKDDHTQESIARSVALKAAVDYSGEASGVNFTETEILRLADSFLAWLQGGSTGSAAVSTPSAPVTTQATENPQSATTVNPSRPWERITKKQDDRDEDAELRSMMEQMPPDEPGYDYGP